MTLSLGGVPRFPASVLQNRSFTKRAQGGPEKHHDFPKVHPHSIEFRDNTQQVSYLRHLQRDQILD